MASFISYPSCNECDNLITEVLSVKSHDPGLYVLSGLSPLHVQQYCWVGVIVTAKRLCRNYWLVDFLLSALSCLSCPLLASRCHCKTEEVPAFMISRPPNLRKVHCYVGMQQVVSVRARVLQSPVSGRAARPWSVSAHNPDSALLSTLQWAHRSYS